MSFKIYDRAKTCEQCEISVGIYVASRAVESIY